VRWLVIVVMAACQYDDPDYGDARFKCDTAHRCPDGQSCVMGTCSGGGAGTPDGGECGSGGTCDVGMQGCHNSVARNDSCQPGGAACGGTRAICDGLEDCPSDMACCGGNPVCGPTTCTTRVCTDVSDCPPGMLCCPDITGMVQWGTCGSFCL